MSTTALEAYLARLYTDPAARKTFLTDPLSAAREAGLSEADANLLCNIDKVGLHMAAASYAHKREQHRRPKKNLHEFLFRLVASLTTFQIPRSSRRIRPGNP